MTEQGHSVPDLREEDASPHLGGPAPDPTGRSSDVTVHWYDCACPWITKYCDDEHRRVASVPRGVLVRYATDDASPCPHTATTNLRCNACGEFVGVPPAQWSADARDQS